MHRSASSKRAPRRTKAALLAAALGVGIHCEFAHGDVTASWTLNGSGNWTTAADWSTSPNYPDNGTPSGTNYDAEVGLAGSGPYTVTLSSASVQVDQLSLDSANATVDVAGAGSLTLSTLNVNSGLFELTNSATLNAADSSGDLFSIAAGGNLTILNGTINGGELTAATPVSVYSATFNNVLFDSGTTVNVTSGGAITLNNNWAAATINAAGATANLGGSFSLANLNSLNLSNSTVNLTGTLNLNPADIFNPANYGASFSAVGGTISGGTIASGATLNIKKNSTLNLAGSWTNSGTIQGTDVNLNLGGSFTPASLGTINLVSSGGSYSQLNITGTMTIGSGQTYTYNSGQVQLPVDLYITSGTIAGGTLNVGPSSTVVLSGGAISGSTITASSTGQLVLVSGTLDGVTVNTTSVLPSLDTNTPLYIRDGITGAGQQFALVRNYFNELYFDSPSQQISNINVGGEGYCYIGGPTSGSSAALTINSNATLSANWGGTLFVKSAPGVTASLINNGTLSSENDEGYLNLTTTSFTNNNTVNAQGTGMTLAATTWTNNGTIIANGASITFGGSWTNSGTLMLENGGSLVAPNGLNVGDGTLTGSGTLDANVTLSSDPSQLLFHIGGTTQSSEYDSLTFDGNLSLAGDLDILFTNGFQSSITSSEQFILATLGSQYTMTGSFDNVISGSRLETADGLGSFEVSYGGSGQFANEIVLSDFAPTVPEPAALGLLAMASIGVLSTGRRPATQRR